MQANEMITLISDCCLNAQRTAKERPQDGKEHASLTGDPRDFALRQTRVDEKRLEHAIGHHLANLVRREQEK